MALHAAGVPHAMETVVAKIRWAMGLAVLGGAEDEDDERVVALQAGRVRRSLAHAALPCMQALAQVATAAARCGTLPPVFAGGRTHLAADANQQAAEQMCSSSGCRSDEIPGHHASLRVAEHAGCSDAAQEPSTLLAVASLCSGWLSSLLGSGVLQLAFELDGEEPTYCTESTTADQRQALHPKQQQQHQQNEHIIKRQQARTLRYMLHRFRVLQPALARLLEALAGAAQQVAQALAAQADSTAGGGSCHWQATKAPETSTAAGSCTESAAMEAQAFVALQHFVDLHDVACTSLCEFTVRLDVAYPPPRPVSSDGHAAVYEAAESQRKLYVQQLQQRRGFAQLFTLEYMMQLLRLAREAIACVCGASEALQDAVAAARSAVAAGAGAGTGLRHSGSSGGAASGSAGASDDQGPSSSGSELSAAAHDGMRGAAAAIGVDGSCLCSSGPPQPPGVGQDELLLRLQATSNDWALFSHLVLLPSLRCVGWQCCLSAYAGPQHLHADVHMWNVHKFCSIMLIGIAAAACLNRRCNRDAYCGNQMCQGAPQGQVYLACPGHCGVSFCSEACMTQARHLGHQRWCQHIA